MAERLTSDERVRVLNYVLALHGGRIKVCENSTNGLSIRNHDS